MREFDAILPAFDGVVTPPLSDYLTMHLYGGRKFTMRKKILETIDGRVIFERPLKALDSAKRIGRIIVPVYSQDYSGIQAVIGGLQLEKEVTVIQTDKKRFGDILSDAEKEAGTDYLFWMLPDVPFVDGKAIDLAASQTLSDTDIYIPLVSKSSYQKHVNWARRSFIGLNTSHGKDSFIVLDYLIWRKGINFDLPTKIYECRQLKSLKGVIKLFLHDSRTGFELLEARLQDRLSLEYLESLYQDLSGDKLQLCIKNEKEIASGLDAFSKDVNHISELRKAQELSHRLSLVEPASWRSPFSPDLANRLGIQPWHS